MNKFILFLKAEDGTTAIEYALIASLICLAIVVAVTTLGGNLNQFFFQKVADGFPK